MSQQCACSEGMKNLQLSDKKCCHSIFNRTKVNIISEPQKLWNLAKKHRNTLRSRDS
jgi:hypothetical protein